MSFVQQKGGRLICLDTFRVGTAFLNMFLEGRKKEEIKGTRGRKRSSYCMTSRKKRVLEVEIGSTRSRAVGNLLWKTLWTYLKADYRLN